VDVQGEFQHWEGAGGSHEIVGVGGQAGQLSVPIGSGRSLAIFYLPTGQ
jgi:hypothetical protein